MSSADDLVSTQKGGVQTLGQYVQYISSPGRTTSSTTSPKATIITTLGTASFTAIAASTTRRAIEFINSNPSGPNMWVVSANVAAATNQGIYIPPGGFRRIPHSLAANAGFNAIAATGSSNTLTIVEFF